LEDYEPARKVRQAIKVLGKTQYCSKCEDAQKEMAAFYCGCGTFLCAQHVLVHSCVVTQFMGYNEELLKALS
jgi:hypothetical protein